MEVKLKSLDALEKGDKVYCCFGGKYDVLYRRTDSKTKLETAFYGSFHDTVLKTKIVYDVSNGFSYKIIYLQCNWKFDSRTGKALNSPYGFKIESNTFEETPTTVSKSPEASATVTKCAEPTPDAIMITRDELIAFYNDICAQTGCWSNASYRLCDFIDIDPTEGV